MEYGVLMAGGSGTRLWPLSRAHLPKQLLKIVQGKSLLQLSYERLRGILPAQQIYVCTGEAHRQIVLENLPELPSENILGEPEGRDTANAVGFAAAVLRQRDPDAVAAFVTADHVIEPVDQFQKSLRTAFDLTHEKPNALVTFGIVPTHGHTGLGYVQRAEAVRLATGSTGAFRVQAFKEKPDKSTADRYVESGRYYWNSGMFVWRCDTVLAELQAFLPAAHDVLMQVARAWDTPERAATIQSLYPTLPKISIDYAVMEPASQSQGKAQVYVVEMPVQWLDVGSWPALAETLKTDDHNNAVFDADYVFIDSDDNIIISSDPSHLISTIGLTDMIVVHTADATMVCPRSESQRVKELVARIKEKTGNRYQ